MSNNSGRSVVGAAEGDVATHSLGCPMLPLRLTVVSTVDALRDLNDRHSRR